jgi:hypothetical protein
MSMKILAAALSVLSIGLLATFASSGQPQTTDQPRFQYDIQASTDRGPRITFTNLSSKALTACYLEISSSSRNRKLSGINWDAVVQGKRPLEPGASISLGLPYVAGGPLPDKVEVAAGVWADGDSFGRAELVRILLGNRALREAEYDQAASLLQQGMDQNWTRDQYLAGLSGNADTAPIYAIRSTLEANQHLNEKPRNLQSAMQILLDSFNRRREQLRQAKPSLSVIQNQP